MVNYLLFILPLFFISFIVQDSYAQTIIVNQTTPCFLNYTAGYHIWDNCGMDDDYLKGALIGFEWVTGGYFSLIFVGLIILVTYIKYHKAIYPVIVGISFIPVAIFLVPNYQWQFILVAMGIALAAGIAKAIKNHTGDFT